MSEKFLEVGKIVTVHALKGEVKIQPWCDSPDFLCEFDTLYLDTNGENTLEVEKSRVFKNMVITKFCGYNTVEEAAALRDKVLYIDRDDVELPEGVFFISDLIGMQVEDAQSGQNYGTITEVMQTGANDVYAVNGQGREYLIPAIPDVVKSTDLENKKMLITPLEGLFDDEN
ncbi:MAG: ribosome maturation factor RimM [Oscillospiraceae bacterium]|nr:ribosome maturation factor RimM [Oscillospiraceae bacterium]